MSDYTTRQNLYLLVGKYPVPVGKVEWAEGIRFGQPEWTVDKTTVFDTLISTVFLGIDHGFMSDTPMLFETMVFGGAWDGHMWRCATWEEAERQHADAVATIRRTKIAN